MQNKLVMRYPADWHGDMWREGAPFGNGLIGGLVYGGLFKENILINHALLWRGGINSELPDISYVLPEIRKLLDDKKIVEADKIITNTLTDKGYKGEFVTPDPVCDIIINTSDVGIFKNYRRVIEMDKAQINVSWQDRDKNYNRSTFASRKNNLIFTKYTCNNGFINTKITLAMHDTETLADTVIPDIERFTKKDMAYFAAKNVSVYKPGDYGAVLKIITDGKTKEENGFISVLNATQVLVIVKIFIETDRKIAFLHIEQDLNKNYDYDFELTEHTKLHNALYGAVDFSISSSHTSNEELLLEAFDGEASNELTEKLYAYGRYLFICSTSDKNTLPCHLTGLFNGTYKCFWAFYMYNVNFEMIYWQALTGNLPSFLKLALDYTEAFIPDFRENAKKIFGCRGILINSVNAPDSGLFKCLAHHIVNWTGGAAWFSQHYWDYYRFTEDTVYLKEHALPFMYETALFYEDFVVENQDGYYDLYPSVSPENTADNIAKDMAVNGIETCKNAAMEFALLKELLTNLISGCEITGMYPDKLDKWKEMLSKVRPYMVNEDGAIKEWSDNYYKDNYCHRHHSHVYPIFPGCEVSKGNELYAAFEKAEEMRLKFGISDQSSWSVVFMAGIASRMGKSELCLELLNAVSKTCLMNNFLTVHNDWRRMGPIACADFRTAPFQIDANIGIPGVINEMLLQSQQDDIFILPALPKKWEMGHVKGLLARGSINCGIIWDNNGGYLLLKTKTKKKKQIRIGSGFAFADGSDTREVDIDGELKIEIYVKNNIDIHA